MDHEAILWAVEATERGLCQGREYEHNGFELYRRQGADGTDYVLSRGDQQVTFTDPFQAAFTFFSLAKAS